MPEQVLVGIGEAQLHVLSALALVGSALNFDIVKI